MRDPSISHLGFELESKKREKPGWKAGALEYNAIFGGPLRTRPTLWRLVEGAALRLQLISRRDQVGTPTGCDSMVELRVANDSHNWPEGFEPGPLVLHGDEKCL